MTSLYEILKGTDDDYISVEETSKGYSIRSKDGKPLDDYHNPNEYQFYLGVVYTYNKLSGEQYSLELDGSDGLLITKD